MRRAVTIGLAVFVTLAVLAPAAFAQAPAAPAPKVTINGFIQQVTSWTRNLSSQDLDVGRAGDKEWYSRTRLRFDPSFEVGQVKAGMRLEFDQAWGDTQQGATTAIPKGTGAVTGGLPRTGTNGGSGLNTDVLGAVEVTWLFTEFPVTGAGSLMPFIPVPTRGRFGLQPFESTIKLGVLANSDFAGALLRTTLTPNVTTRLHYAQAEEKVKGPRDGFFRGDNWVGIASVNVTPMKGLDVRPLIAYLSTDGITGARIARGGFSNAVGGPFQPGGGLPAGTSRGGLGANENRYTIGLDAAWRSGPFSFEPTIFYQFGRRESAPCALADAALRAHEAGFACGAGTALAQNLSVLRSADIDAWFIDLRGGFRVGPLLLEAMGMYTSGNKAQARLSESIRYYEPITTDTTYYAGWAELFALNVDFTQMGVPASGAGGLGASIGYDRYGRAQLGARVSYDVTPAFTLEFKHTTAWTAEEVDTDGFVANGITPSFVDRTTFASARPKGDARYLGSEFDIGFSYRFAPSIFFQTAFGYLFAGDALGHRFQAAPYSTAAPATQRDGKVNDVQILSARVNYSF